jgi:hypothetical protein
MRSTSRFGDAFILKGYLASFGQFRGFEVLRAALRTPPGDASRWLRLVKLMEFRTFTVRYNAATDCIELPNISLTG